MLASLSRRLSVVLIAKEPVVICTVELHNSTVPHVAFELRDFTLKHWFAELLPHLFCL
jgi:hypothetical protein